MTKADIITKFNLYMDDTSELSSSEESDLFDKVYRQITADRPWEATKKAGTGTTSTSVAYISLPTDFLFLTANANHTTSDYGAEFPVIFRGSTFDEYQVVSWSDRRQYRNANKAYVDFANSRLYFTVQPTVAEAVEFDYHSQVVALGDTDSPWFPSNFHDLIYHLMCSDSFMIQQSDKAKSYASENKRAAQDILDKMIYWNSNLVQI